MSDMPHILPASGVQRYSVRTGCDHLPGVPELWPLGPVMKFLGASPQLRFSKQLALQLRVIPDLALHVGRAPPVGPERLQELPFSPPLSTGNSTAWSDFHADL